MKKNLTEVDGVKYKNLTEKNVSDLKTTIKTSKDPEAVRKAAMVLKEGQVLSRIRQAEHDAGSFKAATGKFATTADIPTNEDFTKRTIEPSKSFDYTRDILEPMPELKSKNEISDTVKKVASKATTVGKKGLKSIPIIGGLMAAAGSGDLMAAVPVLGSADEVGKGSDISAKSKEEKAKMEQEARMRMAKQIEESKKPKKSQNMFDIIKEKLKK